MQKHYKGRGVYFLVQVEKFWFEQNICHFIGATKNFRAAIGSYRQPPMIAQKTFEGRENLLGSQLPRDCKLQTLNNKIMLVKWQCSFVYLMG